MIKNNLFAILIIITIFISCRNVTDKADGVVSDYISEKVWTRDIVMNVSVVPVQEQNFIYGMEIENRDYKPMIQKGFKLNLEDGSIVWKTESFESNSEYPPVLHDGKVYLLVRKGQLLCFDTNTGKKLATIRFKHKEDNSNVAIQFPSLMITSDGKYFLWNYYNQNNKNDDGIMRASLEKIDFSKNPNDEQVIYPDLIWCGNQIDTVWNIDEHIYANLKEENGTVYFMTYGKQSEGSFGSKIGSMDVETGELNWIREAVGFEGYNFETLYIVDNRLYVFEVQVGCFDKNTGETIWEHIQTEKDFRTEHYIGGLIINYAGVFYDDGCFYYTTAENLGGQMANYDPSLSGNIKCLDAKNGKLKWDYMPKGSGSLSTRPVVIGNKVFVNTWNTGLWVFDKTSGKPIGVDRTVSNPGCDRNYECNGNFIYFNDDTDRTVRTLTCIKP